MHTKIRDPFRRFVYIMERLQGPGGCPWDLEQTHESLKPYMLEEAYEVLDAIDQGDFSELEEELGDVMLQVVFHAVLAAREKKFTIDDVLKTVSAKMIRRHPHVFGETEARTAGEVLQNWEKLKQKERAGKARRGGKGKSVEKQSVLSGIPSHFPALLKAQRIQEKAARVGFEWENPLQALDKVEEEVGEVRQALAASDKKQCRREIGDLIFALVNLARFMKIDAEEAVRQTAERFRTRFLEIERESREQDRPISEMSADEMLSYWQTAKNKKPSRRRKTKWLGLWAVSIHEPGRLLHVM
jgi:tetrapyrrole methylase family protein / MazG family protein